MLLHNGGYTALHHVRTYPDVNSRARLVTLAPGLRPERRFAPLARELTLFIVDSSVTSKLEEISNVFDLTAARSIMGYL